MTSTASNATASCIKTTYASNDTTWVRDRASEVITYESTCPTTATPHPTIKRAVQTFYDGASLGNVTDGQPTKTLTATAMDGNDPNWVGAIESTTTYDAYGRVKASTIGGRTTTTTYTPSGPGATTRVSTQLALAAHHTSVDLDPGRGNPLSSNGVDGLVTSGTYDALGRLTSVWRPGQTQGVDPPTETYDYTVGPNAPLAVTSRTLLDRGHGRAISYSTRVVIYDAFGAVRQAQADADTNGGGAGRVVTDNFTDSHGWSVKAYDHWYTSGSPTTSIVTTPQANIDDWSTTSYDGSGRPTAVTSHKTGDTETSPGTGTVKTYYTGNATTVINPTGGVSSTTITNGRGDKVEQRNYKTLPTISGSRTDGWTVTGGTYQKLTYSYDGIAQQLTQTTGATDASTALQTIWSTTYDLAGRVTTATSPDAGTTGTTYWPTGEVKTTTDAAGRVVYNGYDAVGRPIDRRLGSATGTQLASWTYDDTTTYGAVGVGRLASSTSYNAGKAYTKTITGYDPAGRPLGTKITLNEPGLNTSYTSTQTWTSTGLLATKTLAGSVNAVGGTGGSNPETLDYYYNDAGNPLSVLGTNSYLTSATYTPYGEPAQYVYDVNDHTMARTFTRDAKTRRITESLLTGQLAAPQIEKTAYTYDAAGNVTKVVDQQGNASTGPVQTTCYAYDTLRQLTGAWSATDACATNPASAGVGKVGGEQPFWTTWTYNDAGNRTQEVKHPLGTATGSTTTYVNGSGTHPHALASTSGSLASTYTYKSDGAMDVRTVGSGTSAKTTTFGYAGDGSLDTVSTATGTTATGSSKYIRDADGNVLLRRDTGTSTPTTTLFVGDGQEVSVNTATKAVSVDRYYQVGDQTIAMRTNRGSVRFLIPDLNGTNQIAVVTDSWTVVRRYSDPYGNLLANKTGAPAPGTLPGSHGFLNLPENKISALDELGARLYDPLTGRFTSVDPVLNAEDPAAANGYTYASNNPVAYSDPSGLNFIDAPNGGTSADGKQTPVAPAPTSFAAGFTQGAGDGAASIAQSFSPSSIAGSIKKLITDPPGVKAFFKAVVTSLTHADEFKAAFDAWKDGDDFEFGKSIGKLVVTLSGDLLTTILGGAKVVSALKDALKGASAATKVGATEAKVAAAAAKTGAELPEGYSSFSAAKRAMGSPGEGNVFDHVVEQSQIKRSGFAPEEIHNPFNMNPVSARTNQIKANYYSSKQPFTDGGTVRDWLTGQSFADQYSFGVDVLTQIRRGVIQ